MPKLIFDSDKSSDNDLLWAIHSKDLYLALWDIDQQLGRIRRGKESLGLDDSITQSDNYHIIVDAIADRIQGIIKDYTSVNLLDL